jgi:4-amino-4-deoxy-L-arabinose transferase-like glycosyltransferase
VSRGERGSGARRALVAALDPWLVGALALGLLLRAGLVLRYPSVALWHDETLHYVMSVVAANVDAPVLGHWPPAYEVFLGALFRLAGPELSAARWAQVGLSTLSIACVYGIAARAGGRRAARIAGLACAVHPSLVAYSHYLYSETLFIALLAASVWLYFRCCEPPRRSGLVGAGVLFGLAALTRSTALYFLPVWLAWLAWRRREELPRAALFALAALAAVLPWTLRNAVVLGELMPVDGAVGRTVWWAYNEAPYRVDLGTSRIAAVRNREECRTGPAPRHAALPTVPELRQLFPPDPELPPGVAGRLTFDIALVRNVFAARDFGAFNRCELANAWRFVRERPGTALARVGLRVYDFWAPTSFLLRSVAWKSYPGGPLGASAYPLQKWVVVASHVALVLLALAALGRRWHSPVVDWMVLFGVFYVGFHALAVAASRYRLPLEPFLIVLAALWLAQPGPPETRARALGVAGAAGAFLLLCAHYLATLLP